MARTEFCKTLVALGIPQRRLAQLFGVGGRSARRWSDGTRRTPRAVAILIDLLLTEVVSINEVEQAAARTNGSARPEPPVVVAGRDPTVAPAPEQSVVARAAAAARAGPESTAEKVRALAANCCHWPVGDPAHPSFHFCGDPVVRKPYCEHHRAVASRGAADPARRPRRAALKMSARRATSSMADPAVIMA